MGTPAASALETIPENARAALPAAHEGIELLWPDEHHSAAAPMARRGVLLCQAGQAVARALPHPAHPHAHPAAATLRLGPGVAWDAGRAAYVARKNGYACLVQNRLDVLETLEWTGNLDAAGGPFSFEGDVNLRCGVLDLAVLRCARDLTVVDCIEAADVQAGRDITVLRGICGKEKGAVRAGRRVAARFLTNARIIAGGDVVIEKEIDNSLVQCNGELRVDRGAILSGHVQAVAGIRCHTAGSPSGVKTILELGASAELQAEISRISNATAAQRQKARDIRTAVEPLMARQKSLTPAQKEKATELLFLAGQCAAEAQELTQRLALLMLPVDAARQGTIRIAAALHPGVIIRFPSHQARTTNTLPGPLTVKLLVSDTQNMIAAIDDLRGTPTILQPL